MESRFGIGCHGQSVASFIFLFPVVTDLQFIRDMIGQQASGFGPPSNQAARVGSGAVTNDRRSSGFLKSRTLTRSVRPTSQQSGQLPILRAVDRDLEQPNKRVLHGAEIVVVDSFLGKLHRVDQQDLIRFPR